MAELYGYPVTGSNGLPHGGSIVAKKLGANGGPTGGRKAGKESPAESQVGGLMGGQQGATKLDDRCWKIQRPSAGHYHHTHPCQEGCSRIKLSPPHL